MLVAEKQFVKGSACFPDPGAFALLPINAETPVKWEGCREQFAYSFNNKTEAILFSHSRDASNNIANFIAKTEQILEMEESEFQFTTLHCVIYVKPNVFWTCCPLRRSLFTLLLRAGATYKDNYEATLYSEEYLLQTKKAVMRFLFGFTKFNSSKECEGYIGWYTIFLQKDKRTIKQLLVLPDGVKKELYSVVNDDLWN